jgi:mRNA-degrading endonuclease toxin of MazEF toxin-antitoxin module
MPAASRAWDVVRIECPYANSDAIGVRPALVVATLPATDSFGIVWVLMITSARHAPWPDDVAGSDLAAAGLSRASVIRTRKIAGADGRRLTTIGRLFEPDRAVVQGGVKQISASF